MLYFPPCLDHTIEMPHGLRKQCQTTCHAHLRSCFNESQYLVCGRGREEGWALCDHVPSSLGASHKNHHFSVVSCFLKIATKFRCIEMLHNVWQQFNYPRESQHL